jgi:HD-GYP domain-containing protein (c-di-GMP phosphodiesterase class II)
MRDGQEADKRSVMRTVPVGSLDTLLETLDLRRPAVAAHSRRVAMAARKLGMAVGLDVQELADLTTAALVHDAGSLLGRPTNLLDLEEWCGLSEDVSDILWYSSRPYGHHKHAPLTARILAVAHAFDDLISPREYQVPMSPETARLAIAREAGRRFCPLAANALMMVQPELVDEDADRAVAEVTPCGRADIDVSRLDAAAAWRIDYRLVTTS